MKSRRNEADTMWKEHDFSGEVRGKYASRCAQGTNVVLLDPDLMDVFPDADSVNRALRPIAQIIRDRSRPKTRPRKQE
jgi:hypothetical protein